MAAALVFVFALGILGGWWVWRERNYVKVEMKRLIQICQEDNIQIITVFNLATLHMKYTGYT